MHDVFKEMLVCPLSGSQLSYKTSKIGSTSDGFFVSEKEKISFPIRNDIPRFVDDDNYAKNFGMQWNRFSKTQLDSFSNTTISSDRFWNATGWTPESLKNKWVLDAGCGAGRFAEIALKAGAHVVAIDYSNAVDAAKSNLSQFEKLHLIQADIYNLPFRKESFDYVYSLGVLQHTPNVEKAFKSLVPLIKPGGSICTDYYWKRFRTLLHSKYLFRPITKRIEKEKLFEFLKNNISRLLLFSNILGSVPIIGKGLKRIVPVANYTNIFPLNEQQILEWALLDTFDMLAPTYDNTQSARTVKRFLKDTGLVDIEVLHSSHLVGRATKPTGENI